MSYYSNWFYNTISKIDINKLISNYGPPNIDYLYFFRKRDIEKYNEILKKGQKDNEKYYTYFTPFIHWSIKDKNNKEIALIYIEFYYDHDTTKNKYPVRNKSFDFLFKEIITSSPQVKEKFIQDFISLKDYNQQDYPSLTSDISEFSSNLDYLYSNHVQWYIITKDKDIFNQMFYSHNFGHNGPHDFFGLGINGKISELNAAMGLSVLPKMDYILNKRKKVVEYYLANIDYKNIKTTF